MQCERGFTDCCAKHQASFVILKLHCVRNINAFQKENSKESGVYVIRPVPIGESQYSTKV